MVRVRERANRLLDAFRVKTGTTTLPEHDAPADFILENLDDLKKVAASKISNPTVKQQEALRHLLTVDMPQMRAVLQKYLHEALDPKTGTHRKEWGNTDREFALSMEDTLSLNFVREDADGNPEFDPAVVDAVLMAALSWTIRQGSSGSRPLKKRRIAKAFGISESNVTKAHERAYRSGPRYHEMLSAVARDMEQMLGLKGRSDVSSTLVQGITRSMAANALHAMIENGLLVRDEHTDAKSFGYDKDGKRQETENTYVAIRSPWKASPPRIEVYKSPTCGCCSAWIEHMQGAGFVVDARDIDQDSLWALKARSGITPELGSCHTAFVEGYVVEGHVPAVEVRRLLAERPDARGLAVPGMPYGSPGMGPESEREAYDVLLVRQDGATAIFARYAAA